MRYIYCPVCADKLATRIPENEIIERQVCGKCGFVFYDNPKPACGVVIVDDNQRILLAKRKYPPAVGKWTLPAGFMEIGEGPDECAIRETLEETGLHIKLNGVFNAYKGGDDPRHAVVLIVYLAEVISGEIKPGDDVSEVEYFDINNIPVRIAFSSNEEAIAEYRARFL